MVQKKRGYDEESLIKKTRRRLKELFHGEKTYAKKEAVPSGRAWQYKAVREIEQEQRTGKVAKRKKDIKTVRTKATEKGLKRAGVTEKEKARLRGKH